jgi:hypothetical protein
MMIRSVTYCLINNNITRIIIGMDFNNLITLKKLELIVNMHKLLEITSSICVCVGLLPKLTLFVTVSFKLISSPTKVSSKALFSTINSSNSSSFLSISILGSVFTISDPSFSVTEWTNSIFSISLSVISVSDESTLLFLLSTLRISDSTNSNS